MPKIVSALPRLQPSLIVNTNTGEVTSKKDFEENLYQLLNWVKAETIRLYEQDPIRLLEDAKDLRGSANSYSRSKNYQPEHMTLGREILAKSRLGELVHHKLMSEAASYANSSNPNKRMFSYSNIVNLGAVNSQMASLSKTENQLVLKWKCWTQEYDLYFDIPSYVLKRNIVKYSLPLVSEKGFIFSALESPTRSKGTLTAGVDLGRKEPFTMAIAGLKKPVTSSAKVKRLNNKRENILSEIKYTRVKKKQKDILNLDTTVLDEQIVRLRNKASRLVDPLSKQLAADLVNTAVRQQVSVLHLENLKWATGTKYGSRWAHGTISRKIQHSAARHGLTIKTVNPKNTSQLCSKCNSPITHNNKKRTIWCRECKTRLDRDFNAAINILHNINSSCPDRPYGAVGLLPSENIISQESMTVSSDTINKNLFLNTT